MGMSISRRVSYGFFELEFTFSRLPTYLSFLIRKQKDDTAVQYHHGELSPTVRGPPTRHGCRAGFRADLADQLMQPPPKAPPEPCQWLQNQLLADLQSNLASFLVLWFLLGTSVDPFYFR